LKFGQCVIHRDDTLPEFQLYCRFHNTLKRLIPSSRVDLGHSHNSPIGYDVSASHWITIPELWCCNENIGGPHSTAHALPCISTSPCV